MKIQPLEDYSLQEEIRDSVGHETFDSLSLEEQERYIGLNYLAKILVDAYFDEKQQKRELE